MSILLIITVKSFCQQSAETVVDFDGNIYNTITIGEQTWMKENLRVTHYRNGDSIQNVRYTKDWVNLTNLQQGAYCKYYNSEYNAKIYGNLYNCYAVKDYSRLCPSGWHVPTDEEWTMLAKYLGGDSIAGNKLKELGTKHWESPNTGATNESGFTALPGGYRSLGFFEDIGYNGSWWSSSKDYSVNGLWLQKPYDRYWYRYIKSDKKELGRDKTTMQDGYSVRCIKDTIKK
ncbi:MAG: fibrobacter succinogenes major paralogous domain-containing protein [Bacteroidia bacterium]|nr:fibrobacter succinogenes major paralogous domain-containing protein [Bacteroidia bacterium]